MLYGKLAEFHAGADVAIERHLLEGDAVAEIIGMVRCRPMSLFWARTAERACIAF